MVKYLHNGVMDLAHPLRSLVPSLDSAVLEVLARTESGLSATQITRLSHRGTRAGQRPVLDRLVEHGLVVADPSSTGHLYRLNRGHLLADAVLSAARARSTLLERLAAACLALRPAPIHASVFGSVARGEGGAESDVDLMLVMDADADLATDDWDEQLRSLEDSVHLWTGNRLETVVLDHTRLRAAAHRGELLMRTWSRDARTLIGPTPDELLRPTRTRVRT